MFVSDLSLFSGRQVNALPSLNLGDHIHRDQVIELRSFGHVVQAYDLVDIAHAETFMCPQDCEECHRNGYGPNNQTTTA